MQTSLLLLEVGVVVELPRHFQEQGAALVATVN
jgi:hypothetical protein